MTITSAGISNGLSSSLVRGDDGGAGSFGGSFHDLSGLQSSGGNLAFNIIADNDSSTIFSGAILEVTAVPEPASFAFWPVQLDFLA